MSKKVPFVALLVIQAIALILYPPSYFGYAPQAAVFPPTLLLMLIATLVLVNTSRLQTEAGRTFLVFIQGVNIVIRAMTVMPNLINPDGNFAALLLIFQVLSIAASWYTMMVIERYPLSALMLKKQVPAS